MVVFALRNHHVVVGFLDFIAEIASPRGTWRFLSAHWGDRDHRLATRAEFLELLGFGVPNGSDLLVHARREALCFDFVLRIGAWGLWVVINSLRLVIVREHLASFLGGFG